MNICIYVCMCVFLFAHRFPGQTNKKIKMSGQVGKCWEKVEFRCLSPLRVFTQAHSSVAHTDQHITSQTGREPPYLSSCVCLGVEVSGDEQKNKLHVPWIYS